MKVSEMIRNTRIESGLTQEEYGAKFGVTRQTVSSWENDRSLPDLQMLIDICNTYRVSLDQLLNDDKAFVDQIDYYSRLKRIIKRAAALILIVFVLFAGVFIRWKFTADDKNEAFADVTAQMDFVKDGKSGMYVLQKDDAVFSLPNQKLPFLREDFYVKNAYADFVIDGTEIEITVYEGMTFHIELNHYRSLEGVIGKDGSVMIEENTLNRKEQQFYDRHDEEINGTLKQLVEIYEAVY